MEYEGVKCKSDRDNDKNTVISLREIAEENIKVKDLVEDAIIVESDFDLDETYETKDYSSIDPIEGFNRGVWDFNLGLDKTLVRPVTRGYVNVVPDPFRRGLGNAVDNFFTTPQYFVNNLLQGKIGGAFSTVSRLVINSTIGLGGFIDVASKMGIQERPETFGEIGRASCRERV